MNALTNPPSLAKLAEALQEFSDDGFITTTVRVSRIEVGDYVVSYPCEFESPEAEKRTRKAKVERVIARYFEQGSGPNPSRQFLALEGNPKIQAFANDPLKTVLTQREPL